MKHVFLLGDSGTTGLRIRQRLADRDDIDLMMLPAELRHDPAAQKEALNDCDAALLCLPDDAARAAVAMVENPKVAIFDTSTAHRTDARFVYGFPELIPSFAEQAHGKRRIAVPGCHASGFIATVRPLVEAGLLSRNAALSAFSLTGYSGGGKKMIAEYEDASRPTALEAPRVYALSGNHKHLPEMQAYTGLSEKPVFLPVVAPYYSGMTVLVPLPASSLRQGVGKAEIEACLAKAYPGPVVRVHTGEYGEPMLAANALAGSDAMELFVFGSEGRLTLAARYDNLGKGASGTALQCLNLYLGCPAERGLCL